MLTSIKANYFSRYYRYIYIEYAAKKRRVNKKRPSKLEGIQIHRESRFEFSQNITDFIFLGQFQ